MEKEKKYRVVTVNKVGGEDHVSVSFVGSLTRLAERHPRWRNWRHDSLHPSFSCGDFDSRTSIEVETEQGWVKCMSDPRPIR